MTPQTAPEKHIWIQWFAGFMDGDGCILVYKDHVSMEITTALEDESVLYEIKKYYGGSVRARSNAKAVRWRSRKKDVVVRILHEINGLLQNTIRRAQFKAACVFYGIDAKPCVDLTALSPSYYAGLFDADGTIVLSISIKDKTLHNLKGNYGKAERLLGSRGANQVGIKFTNKYKQNVEIFQKYFKFGYLCHEQHAMHPKWNWFVEKASVHAFINILQSYPLKSTQKRRRLHLLKKYFELKDIKAHLAEKHTKSWHEWKRFCYTWYGLEI
uniref:LAGLIDADG homing endonuclease n=1 Tax=Marophrys sp. SRT127 TaxID=2488311 RepID=A0A455RFF9_9EUKA|nr:LAGLIDADG homing endonuclease [Marophrys sp. SRT127]